MALSPIFYARGDSSAANNAELNVQNVNTTPVTSIQFTSGTSGDLLLDYVPDGPDANTLPEFDPDTQVIINGQTYNFVLLKIGTLDPARVPGPLANDLAYVIRVDFNRDGDINDSVDQQYFFTQGPDNTQVNMAAIQQGALRLANVVTAPPPIPVCFCEGTEILTPEGPRPVETLAPGDMVLTATGATSLLMWVGVTRLPSAVLRDHSHLRPIRIEADSLAPGVPDRVLRVSPQHRILITHPACDLLFGEASVLVPAKYLVGYRAQIENPPKDVAYYHLLLKDHEMLISNGLVSESFQPARRMIDVMGRETREALEAVLRACGAEAMLARKDGFPSLHKAEAAVLMDWLGHSASLAAGNCDLGARTRNWP